MENQLNCTNCDAPCCRQFEIGVRPKEGIKELLETHYGRAIDKVLFTVTHDCRHLVDNRCSIYESRPQMCRQFECRPNMRPNVLRIDVQ